MSLRVRSHLFTSYTAEWSRALHRMCHFDWKQGERVAIDRVVLGVDEDDLATRVLCSLIESF